MFGEIEHHRRQADELLDVQEFETILEENDLTHVDVLSVLIERGLIEVWIDVEP